MLFTVVLKENKAFQRCYRKGRFTANGYVCAYFFPNRMPVNRLGITVSKKNGNAVQRNRIKRIVRVAYRLNEDKLPIGYDIVFVGRNDIAEKSSADIEKFICTKLVKEMNSPEKKDPRKKNGRGQDNRIQKQNQIKRVK